MAKAINIPTVSHFDVSSDPTSLSQRWTKWLKQFVFFTVGSGITDNKQKRALLLHLAGPDVQEIFETLNETGDEDNYDRAVEKLTEYFQPKKNVAYERHLFRTEIQKESETVEQFSTRLKHLALTCEFGDMKEDLIRDQIIDKCKSHELRRKFLLVEDLKLPKLLDIARAYEGAHAQAAKIEGPSVNPVINKIKAKPKSVSKPKVARERQTADAKCYRCGKKGHYARDCEITKGQTCRKCGNVGHFAKMCKSKISKQSRQNVKHLDESSNSEGEENVFILGSKFQHLPVMVKGMNISFLIDSGASCNVIDKVAWKKLKKKVKLKECKKKVYAYGAKTPLHLIGKFEAEISVGGQTQIAEFLVTDSDCGSLLGYSTATALQVLKIGENINAVNSGEGLKSKYPECFQGTGKLKDFQLKLHIDRSVKPVAQPLRRLPFSLREKVEKKLEDLESRDIIEKTNGPTPWVSPLLVVPKGQNDVRICLDFRQANRAIQRERHPIPTVDEIIHEMNSAAIFSKIDLKEGFHQIELEESSRYITTFVTSKGLYRYKRLMFGINSAPEIYQFIISQVLEGLEGVKNIADDIIIYAPDKITHDLRLKAVFERLRERGLTVNYEKCRFCMDKLVFHGHVLSKHGIGPEQSKVDAILNARRPQNVQEVRSLLGLANWNHRFIPDLAAVTEPLRRLTRKGAHFKWTCEQTKAFENLKKKLASAETLGYFDPKAKTTVIADAGPLALGAVLIQEQNGQQRIIQYASRSLTKTEQRYSTTEKEALGLVWSCERFRIWLIGLEFDLVTDHRALEVIYGPMSKPPPRIERWVLRLQAFNFKVKYKPGKYNIADPLSRLTQENLKRSKMSDIAEEYVKFIALNDVPKAMTAREIEQISSQDPEITRLRDEIRRNGDFRDLPEFKHVRKELTVLGKLVLRGTRIVIPKSLRYRIIKLAHQGHQGIVKTKQRLRETVYWPGMDNQVEREVKKCNSCQLVGQPEKPEPLTRTKLPEGPWQHLSIDLMGPFPYTGEYVFVAVDYFSRWFEVDILKSTTSSKIIESLDKMFITHGLPISIKSDNAPNFKSEEFEDYLRVQGIEHSTSTPYWAPSNGEVERMNRTILKAIKTLQAEKGNWKKHLNEFIFAYRTTPNSVTGVSPAEMMFRRKLRTKLPYLVNCDIEKHDYRERDMLQKEVGKEYADTHRNAERSDISKGDSVLVERKEQNKLTPRFEPEPYLVREKMGNQVSLEKDGVIIGRNVSQVKKYYNPEEKSLETTPEQVVMERPKREIKKPKYLEDYVT